MNLSKVLWIYCCAMIAAVVAEANIKKCRTRFTFFRPTHENVLSILFGAGKGEQGIGEQVHRVHDSSRISFNHGDSIFMTLFVYVDV